MRLSIIVPVYKVEAYLDFCLTSIARQKVDSCEIILVDDCSPDRCGELCDEWARKDSRFRVIHHEKNKGLSAARNSGLEQACGDYITFIDSDDYISPHTLERNLNMLETYPEADVLEYPVCVYHGARNSYCHTPGKGEIIDYAEWVRRKGYVHCYAWNKIYRRILWRDIRFPEGKWFEDVYTIPSVLQRARGIRFVEKGLLYYCNRRDSIYNTLCEKGLDDLLEANIRLYSELSTHKVLSERDKDDFYLRLCDPQIIRLELGGTLCVPERRIPLHRALFTSRPLNYRLKAMLKALTGRHYCTIVAKTRKLLKS